MPIRQEVKKEEDNIDGVMLKLRVSNPRQKAAVVKERSNINYIAARPGVILNHDSTHGLFGKMEGMTQQDAIQSLGAAKHMIGEKVKNGVVSYRCVISLREKDALRLGVDTPEKWRELTKENVGLIAKGLHIEAKNLEYAAAIHMEKGHPHVHITLWDKNQKVREPYVHPKVTDGIRKSITHNVYKEFLSEWYIEKGLSRDKMIEMQKELLTGIPDEKGEPNGRIPNMRRFSESLYDGFITEIDELAASLPKDGRITYKTLTPEQKKKLNNIIDQIVNNNEDFSMEMDRYLFYSEKIIGLDGKQQSVPRMDKAKADIYNRLGNVLLKGIKDELKEERSREQAELKAERERQMNRAQAQSILFTLFRSLSCQASERRRSYGYQKRELSVEARKDLAKKMENTTHMNWDNERN